MRKWRYWHICILLLSVFAYRILVHGPLLTLASHKICMSQLINSETNWSQLIFKTRKRNTEGAPTAHEASLFSISSGREISKRLFVLPFTAYLNDKCTALMSRYFLPPALAPPLSAGKVFLKYCCLRR